MQPGPILSTTKLEERIILPFWARAIRDSNRGFVLWWAVADGLPCQNGVGRAGGGQRPGRGRRQLVKNIFGNMSSSSSM